MVEEKTLGGSPKGKGKRRTRRGRVLTQYLESQEDQDMTRLFYFTRTQERRREGVLVSWNGGEGGFIY